MFLVLNMFPGHLSYFFNVSLFRFFMYRKHWGIWDAKETAFSLHWPWSPGWLFQPCPGSTNIRIWLTDDIVCSKLRLSFYLLEARSADSTQGLCLVHWTTSQLALWAPMTHECDSTWLLCVWFVELPWYPPGLKVLISQVVWLKGRKLSMHRRIISGDFIHCALCSKF